MERLDEILHEFTDSRSGCLHAAAFIVVDKTGDVIYRGAAGRSNFFENGDIPMGTDSLCWVASFTKLVTAVGIMLLVEQGVLDLDDDVRDILPELKDIKILVGFEADADADAGVDASRKLRRSQLQNIHGSLTIRQLLSHTSGFCYDSLHPLLQEWSRLQQRTAHTFCGSMDGFRHPLVFEPGTSWAYGAGPDWAGRIIEHVCQMTLDDFMQTHIWSKVGAKYSTFHPEKYEQSFPPRLNMAYRIGTAHDSLKPGKITLECPAVDDLGGIGLFSTAEDYALFLSALIRETEPLLQKNSLDTLFSPQLNDVARSAFMSGLGKEMRRLLGVANIDDVGQVDHCLGGIVTLRDVPGRRRKGTASWAGLPNLHWWIDRETGIAAALFTQLLPPADARVTDMVIQLEQALYDYMWEKSNSLKSASKL